MNNGVGTRPTKMFWGITLDAGKRYSQQVKQSFHLSMAALENNPGTNNSFVQVMLQHESQEYLLCTLQHGKLLQQTLDLLFMAGEQVSFSLNGSGVVHLTGYLSPEIDDSMFEDDELEDPDYTMEEAEDDDDDDEEDDEAPELVTPDKVAGAKRKAKALMSGSKRLKLLNTSTDDDDDEEDDDDDEDEDDEDDDDDLDDEEFSDDFEDDEFEDEEDEEDEMEIPVNAKANSSPGKAKKTSPKKAVPTPKQDGKAKTTPKQTPQKSEEAKLGSVADTPTTPNGESAKKKKKKKKKNKGDADTSQISDDGDAPKATTPQSPKKRVVTGGTVVEDVKVGHGPEAKPGKMVSVYYVGTLVKNNKRFDSCEKGKPFRFRLSQGEVIRGWDNGVAGMKVGGKRKILVPASQAYGNVKQGPIPPNSALQFEIELKAVS